MTYLLDANALIALCDADHIFHLSVRRWLELHPKFAICPITEGALVRFLCCSRPRERDLPLKVLTSLHAFANCEFWFDDLSYRSCDLSQVAGHKQVTDAYLANLARSKASKLATFDQLIGFQHPEDCELIPIIPT